MNSQDSSTKTGVTSRRSFLKTSAMVGAVATVPSFAMRAAANNNSKLRIMHIGVGGVGGYHGYHYQQGNGRRAWWINNLSMAAGYVDIVGDQGVYNTIICQ